MNNVVVDKEALSCYVKLHLRSFHTLYNYFHHTTWMKSFNYLPSDNLTASAWNCPLDRSPKRETVCLHKIFNFNLIQTYKFDMITIIIPFSKTFVISFLTSEMFHRNNLVLSGTTSHFIKLLKIRSYLNVIIFKNFVSFL